VSQLVVDGRSLSAILFANAGLLFTLVLHEASSQMVLCGCVRESGRHQPVAVCAGLVTLLHGDICMHIKPLVSNAKEV